MLSLKKETGSGRKGIYSTGLLLKFEEKQIALFNTGKKHAGENLEKLLSQRAKDRSPPIHMSDALSRNVPKEVKTILTNCNVHARRKFVEIFDAYPDGILLPVYVMYHGPAAHTTDKSACTAYPSVRPESYAYADRGDLGTLDRPRPDSTPKRNRGHRHRVRTAMSPVD